MESSQDPGFKHPLPADEPELDLYSIPSHSSWFSWNDIHDIERLSLKEFFDGNSITRTPKIYKDYRDFIISKFREDPSRRLTFTEVRKSLVGDISYLKKVFLFLERWGLINLGATLSFNDEDREDEGWKVRVEEGAPHGVRVVALPNSLKPVSVPPPVATRVGDGVAGVVGNGLTPLASYSDVYDELMTRKVLACGNCKDRCDAEHYEYSKEGSFIICVKCFKNGNYGEGKSVDDFKFIECNGAVWTEAETLLLLESVLKHGDDWELVARNVQTKSKLDCISKLIQLPFGELMLGSVHRKASDWNANGSISSVKQVQMASAESQDNSKAEYKCHKLKNESHQNGDAEEEGPPLKRICAAPLSDAGSSLMKQVARISTLVGPHITASAAEAAVTALCFENQCTREIFDEDDNVGKELGTAPQNNEKERSQIEDSAMEEEATQSEMKESMPEKNGIPLTLRMRAATATALGAAAAHAKLLADQEDREIEHLVATIIDTQLKKLHRKIKHFEDLELIMEKEHAQMEELEDSLIAERMNVLERVFNAGISRWWDHTTVKSQTGGILTKF